MKYIVLSVCVFSLITSCAERVSVDPIPAEELIRSYVRDKEHYKILNVDSFNFVNSQLGELVAIENDTNNLEFFLIFNQSPKLLYYKNGTEVMYIQESK